MAHIANIIGIVGVVLILLAYLLTQAGKISPSELKFPIFNLIGASLVLYSLLFAWNLPSFIIEIFWVLISIYGIRRIIKNRKSA